MFVTPRKRGARGSEALLRQLSEGAREALFPEELAHQPECRPLVAAALNQHVENLALMMFYYDTVCYGSKPAFLCALEAFGADHIVTGSDYPVLQDWEVYRETFAYIERLGLPKEVTDKILHHNAQKLFGFDH
jgi:predicted TIM-barrel fold metal-dependent hydrolase